MNSPRPEETASSNDTEDRRARQLEELHAELLESGSWRRESPAEPMAPDSDELSSAESLFLLIERVRRGPNRSPIRGSPLPALRQPIEKSDQDDASPLQLDHPKKIGRFQIDHVLGRGGFGVVFAAFDPQLARRVALKVPRPDALASPEGQARFLREAKAAALLGHPHIVTVYESGLAGPILYIAYELVDGIALSTWLESHRHGLTYREIAELMVRLASAVQHAHSRNVVHRDLKPANVLLAWPQSQGQRSLEKVDTNRPHDDEPIQVASIAERVKISDFGMAHLADEDFKLTWTGSIVGTPAYLAPEQLHGGGMGLPNATDVYGLGGILYELLAGCPPFSGSSIASVVRAVEHDEPVRPRKLDPRVPKDLDAICLKCLEKKPERRYATAAELGEDLKRFVDGEPIHARAASPVEKLGKWSRRHPWAATFVASLVISSICIAVLWFRAEGHRRSAETQAKNAQFAQQAEEQERKRLERVLYAHDLSLAQHEYTQNYTDRAVRLLEGCPPYLRHWEWRYLNRVCQQEIHSFEELGEPSRTVALSGDGQWVASGNAIWGINRPGVLKIWNVNSGKLVHTIEAHPSSVMDVEFSPDGSRLVSAGTQWHGATPPSGLTIWDVVRGEKIWTNAELNSLAAGFSPDGTLVACGTTDGRLLLHDASSGRVIDESKPHERSVLDLAFSPDGKFLATAGRDGTVSIRDMKAGTVVHTIQRLTDARRVCYSPSGDELAVAVYSGIVKLFEHDDRTIRETYSFRLDERAQSLRYTRDGTYLALSEVNGGIQFVDPKTARTYRELRGHNGDFAETAFSNNGQRMATSGQDGSVKIWDLTRPQPPSSHLISGAHFTDLQDAGDGQHVVVALGFNVAGSNQSKEKSLEFWHVSEKRATVTYRGHEGWPTCAAIEPNRGWLASGSQDATARIWDLKSGQELKRFVGHEGFVIDVEFATKGDLLVTAGLDKTVRIWDSATPSLRKQCSIETEIRCIACPPQQPAVLVGGQDGLIRYWSFDSDAAVPIAGEPGSSILCMAFDPSGDLLATGNSGSTIELWNFSEVKSGSAREPKFVLRGHTESVQSLAFSPDGLRLISTGVDRSIRIWDVESGEELLSLRATSGLAPRVVFGPGPDTITYVSQNTISYWQIDPGPTIDSGPAAAPVDYASKWHRDEMAISQSLGNLYGVSWHARRLADLVPDPVPLRQQSGFALARLGHIDEAIGDLEFVAHNGGSVHSQTTLAFLHAARGDVDSYRRVCRETIAKNRATQDVTHANYLAWMCAVCPGSALAHPESVALAELGSSAGKPDQLNTLGALYCRMGQYDRAIETLNRCIALREQVGVPHDWIFLAMAYVAKGNRDEAQRYLDQSQDWLDRQIQAVRDDQPTDWFFNWRTKIELELFIAEVETALRSAALSGE